MTGASQQQTNAVPQNLESPRPEAASPTVEACPPLDGSGIGSRFLLEQAPTFDLLSQLRSATSEVHEKLDKGVAINIEIQRRIRGTDGGETASSTLERRQQEYRETYRIYLLSILAIERSLESIIDASAMGQSMFRRLEFRPESPVASSLITQDLRDIGVADPEPALKRLNLRNLELDSPAAMAGAQYVRSGSRMGGIVIASIVKENLEFDGAHGARFLNMHGRETRRYFGDYCRGLERFPRCEEECTQAVSAATAVFSAILELQTGVRERLNESGFSRALSATGRAIKSLLVTEER
ncbi:MAG: biliverdin-producing heme oxygenase [Deltaproteobacteria bacterium]|nr:biliverdin-producing heme oxygenase [Deltaproteobacteria bacterium]